MNKRGSYGLTGIITDATNAMELKINASISISHADNANIYGDISLSIRKNIVFFCFPRHQKGIIALYEYKAMIDKAEFEELVRRVRPKIARMGKALLGSEQDAEDIAQEALLRLWLIRNRIEKSNSLDALALVIARNLCISQLRKSSHAPVTLHDTAEITAMNGSNPHTELENAENELWLIHQMEGLPPGEFAILRMKETENMSIYEIAGMLDISENAVKLRLSRARRKLYQEFKERNRR